MNECTRTQHRLNDLLDGLLPASECVRLGEHLRTCRGCRDEYDALRKTVHLLHHARTPTDDGARDRVMRRFRTAAVTISPRRRVWTAPRLVPFGVGGTLAALAAVSLFVYMSPAVDNPADTTPIVINALVRGEPLPTPDELSRITAQHADSSAAVLGVSDEVQQDAISDASSRIDDTEGRP
jgi:anti-sigma factor RsiW